MRAFRSWARPLVQTCWISRSHTIHTHDGEADDDNWSIEAEEERNGSTENSTPPATWRKRCWCQRVLAFLQHSQLGLVVTRRALTWSRESSDNTATARRNNSASWQCSDLANCNTTCREQETRWRWRRSSRKKKNQRGGEIEKHSQFHAFAQNNPFVALCLVSDKRIRGPLCGPRESGRQAGSLFPGSAVSSLV